MCRCDKAELPPPRLPLALWLAAAHGSPVFFPFSFCPSLCCGRASPPSTSSADSGVACRPEAANLPAPDLRQQVLAAITIRRLRLTLRSTHLATVEFCCCISLQPPSHSSDRRNKGQPLKLLKPLPNRLSKPPSSPPQPELVLGRPPARTARLSRPPSILLQVGFALVLPPPSPQALMSLGPTVAQQP